MCAITTCPFCGSTAADIVENVSLVHIYCENCGARITMPPPAVKYWNSKGKTPAERMFDGELAQEELLSSLMQTDTDLDWSSISLDRYDKSIELREAPDDYRMSKNAQRLVFVAGFSTCFVHHLNGGRTSYHYESDDR